MKRLIRLSAILIFMFSCSDAKLPDGVYTEEQMKAVLKDVHLTEAYLSTISNPDSADKVSSAYYNLLFKKHHTNQKAFEKSLQYYTERPEILDTLYSQIAAQLNKPRKTPKKFFKRSRVNPKSDLPAEQ